MLWRSCYLPGTDARVRASPRHSGHSFTADVYAKVGAKLQRQAADTMEGVLGR